MVDKLRTSPNLVGCPKCGSPHGFTDAQPEYVSKASRGGGFSEWLEWSCTICHYAVKTKVMIPEKVKN